MGHLMTEATANAMLNAALSPDLLAKAQTQSPRLQTPCKAEPGWRGPHVGDVQPKGLFRSIEIVESCEIGLSFGSTRGITKKVKIPAFKARPVRGPMGGIIDEQPVDNVLLVPTFIIEKTQTDELATNRSEAIRPAVAA